MDPSFNGANPGYKLQYHLPPSMHGYTAGNQQPQTQPLGTSIANQLPSDGYQMKYQDGFVTHSNILGCGCGLSSICAVHTVSPSATVDNYRSEIRFESQSFNPSALLTNAPDERRSPAAGPGWYNPTSFDSVAIQSASVGILGAHGYSAEPMNWCDSMSPNTGAIGNHYVKPEYSSAQNNHSDFPPLFHPARDVKESPTANEQLPFTPALGPQHSPTSTKEAKKGFLCMHSKCEKVVSRIADLDRHYQTIHNKGTPFYCPVPACKYHEEKNFFRYDKLLSHQRNAHGVRKDEQLSRLEYRRREFSMLPEDEQEKRAERTWGIWGMKRKRYWKVHQYERMLLEAADC